MCRRSSASSGRPCRLPSGAGVPAPAWRGRFLTGQADRQCCRRGRGGAGGPDRRHRIGQRTAAGQAQGRGHDRGHHGDGGEYCTDRPTGTQLAWPRRRVRLARRGVTVRQRQGADPLQMSHLSQPAHGQSPRVSPAAWKEPSSPLLTILDSAHRCDFDPSHAACIGVFTPKECCEHIQSLIFARCVLSVTAAVRSVRHSLRVP